MNRRKFIAGTGAVLVAGGTAGWLSFPASSEALTLDTARQKLLSLDLSAIQFSGDWNAIVTFHHLAQSIEFSLSGFPEHKPDWFKASAGKAAFNLFAAKQRMKHGLAEPIPGAPEIIDDGNMQAAFQRLLKSLEDFDLYSGEFKPHFAYGELSKRDYEKAHVMHINNHFELLQTRV